MPRTPLLRWRQCGRRAAASANKEETRGRVASVWQGVMGTMRGLKARVIGEKEPDVEISAPRDFRHLSSIGWTPENGFEIRNIPPEWRKLFQAAGVKKSELKDKDTAAFVMDIIQKEGGVELLQGGGGGGGGGGAGDAAAAPSAPPPPAPPMPPANAPKAPDAATGAQASGRCGAAAAAGGWWWRPTVAGCWTRSSKAKSSSRWKRRHRQWRRRHRRLNLGRDVGDGDDGATRAMQQKPTKSSVLDDEDDNDEWSQ
jgi:hypothetical protein